MCWIADVYFHVKLITTSHVTEIILEIKMLEEARTKILEMNKKSLKKHMHWHSAKQDI